MGRKKEKSEYGDFQTPPALARRVCALLAERGVAPVSLLEPTCGLGSFLFAGLDQFKDLKNSIAAEINPSYVEQTGLELRRRQQAESVDLVQADFFTTDWREVLRELPEPILVLGNPPWVTNSRLGVLESRNVPVKSNFQKHGGLDAVTGKSNFDISEWMLIRLFEAMDGRSGALAMLCKSSTARKVLEYAWEHGIALEQAEIYRIDADLHFHAAVEAVLLAGRFRPGVKDNRAKVYGCLHSTEAQQWIGWEDGVVLADLAAYERWKHLCGNSPLQWRSGIKHDCSQVMELRPEGSRYRNGLGQLLELEEDLLYPMLKSSDVAKGTGDNVRRVMLVTQRRVGDDTRGIEAETPKTWSYLVANSDRFNKRASSIYRNRPQFSIFGIGEYSFAAWKVAISGFYKDLTFVAVGPANGKPVVFDDTSYFLPCESKEQADFLAAILNAPEAQAFFRAFVFWDNKRPITAELLRRLDLYRLAKELGMEERFAECFGSTDFHEQTARKKPKRNKKQLELWSK